MFGYVNIDKLELKVKEYYQYKGYYCGLCHSLKNSYGQLSRMTLNYDMTFLILLLSSLYEAENKVMFHRCMVHPSARQKVIINPYTRYAAAMNVLLSYHKCKDNWIDERDIKSIVYLSTIKKAFKKAKNEYPQKAQVIEEHLQRLHDLEDKKIEDLDEVAGVFAQLMAELTVYKDDAWAPYLRRIGYYLGKYIYILDAYDDLEMDIKKHAYNPLKTRDKAQLTGFIYESLTLQLANLEQEIAKLPLIEDKGIIDNILYSGILLQLNKKIHQKENHDEGPLRNTRIK